MAMTGMAGLVLGGLYLACGRNLWPAIVAHGTTNTISFLVLYFGLMPTWVGAPRRLLRYPLPARFLVETGAWQGARREAPGSPAPQDC